MKIDFSNSNKIEVFFGSFETAFTRCRHILKTVKNMTDRPPVHTKTAHYWPANFENSTGCLKKIVRRLIEY